MNGAAEAATQSGNFSGAMWALVALGLLGFVILIFPDIVTRGGWRWLFGLMGLFVRLFPEKWQSLVARLLGLLYIIIAVVLGFLIVALGEFAGREEFLMGVKSELWEMKTPYTIRFTGNYKAELYLPEKPSETFNFQFEDLSDKPPKDVAQKMIEEADRHFGRQSASQGSVEPPATSSPTALLPETGTEDLSTADRLLQDAAVKWQAGDLNGSIQLAEKALEIQTRILGATHETVTKTKLMITNANLNLIQE
jgi:hypothetical protein